MRGGGSGSRDPKGTESRHANLSIGTTQWLAGLAGGSGPITVTALSDERVAGTFSLALVASDGAHDPQTRSVTKGQFDIAR